MRFFNAIVLFIIGLSLFFQSLSVFFVLQNGLGEIDGDALYLMKSFSLVIMLGMFLAFIKLLLNTIRCFKNSEARWKVFYYLLINLWPLICVLFISLNSLHILPNIKSQAEPASSQFDAGYAWAKEREVTSIVLCKGSHEFNRGCWRYIDEHRAALFQAGKEWAKINLPRKASKCKGAVEFIKGCRNYLSENLGISTSVSQGSHLGMSKAECKIEVDAAFDLMTRDFLENGNQHGASTVWRRSWSPALSECESLL